MGMEKCGKMCENVENVEKCAGDPFSIYYLYISLIIIYGLVNELFQIWYVIVYN